MNTSAPIADPLLRRAFGQRARPTDPQGTVNDWRPSSWRLSPELRAPVSRRGLTISRRTVINNAG